MNKKAITSRLNAVNLLLTLDKVDPDNPLFYFNHRGEYYQVLDRKKILTREEFDQVTEVLWPDGMAFAIPESHRDHPPGIDQKTLMYFGFPTHNVKSKISTNGKERRA